MTSWLKSTRCYFQGCLTRRKRTARVLEYEEFNFNIAKCHFVRGFEESTTTTGKHLKLRWDDRTTWAVFLWSAAIGRSQRFKKPSLLSPPEWNPVGCDFGYSHWEHWFASTRKEHHSQRCYPTSCPCTGLQHHQCKSRLLVRQCEAISAFLAMHISAFTLTFLAGNAFHSY